MPRFFIFLVFAMIFTSGHPAIAAEETLIDRARIDDFIEEQMRIAAIPGLALAVVYEGEPVYIRGYGTTGNGMPVTGETPFIIGSVSKSFTALAVMQLVEDGKLDLDQRVQEYLPWFSMTGAYDAEEITVRQLLVQTSGIPMEAGVTSLARNSSETAEAEAQALSEVPLAAKPGSTYLYSNANYNILGLLVDEVTSEGYSHHVRERIFTPLGMSNSHLSLSSGIEAGMARGHTKMFGFPLGREVQYLDNSLAAGFIISCAGDMANYLLMHVNGGRFAEETILDADSMRELYRPGRVAEGNSNYAMGLVVETGGNGTLIMHDGGTEGFNSGLVFSPDEQWGVVVLTNVGTMIELPALPLALGLGEMIGGREPEPGLQRARNYYLAGLVVMSVLLVLTIRSIFILPRKWAMKVANAKSRGLMPFILNLAPPVFLEAALPLAVFLILPAVAGFPLWRLLALFHPDLVWGLQLLAALLLVKVLWRLVIVATATFPGLRPPRAQA